jgi:hypothetical protein
VLLSLTQNSPILRRYHANLAIHTAGRYSILTVIAAEVFEFMVQTNNANNLAKYLDWRNMQLYGSLIFANFVLFGICILTPDRVIPSSALITIDVLIGESAQVPEGATPLLATEGRPRRLLPPPPLPPSPSPPPPPSPFSRTLFARADATYIMFNIFFVSQPTSFWAIIIPLWFQVDMVNDAFTREAQEQVNYLMVKHANKKQLDEAKASGTLPDELCAHFMAQLNSGAARNRVDVKPPSGYTAMKPHMTVEDSEETAIITVMLEFVVQGVTPGQAFSFSRKFTAEERGTGTVKTLEVRKERCNKTNAEAGSHTCW